MRCSFKRLERFPQSAKVMSLPPDPPPYYDGMSINDFYTKYINDYSVTGGVFLLTKNFKGCIRTVVIPIYQANLSCKKWEDPRSHRSPDKEYYSQQDGQVRG